MVVEVVVEAVVVEVVVRVVVVVVMVVVMVVAAVVVVMVVVVVVVAATAAAAVMVVGGVVVVVAVVIIVVVVVAVVLVVVRTIVGKSFSCLLFLFSLFSCGQPLFSGLFAFQSFRFSSLWDLQHSVHDVSFQGQQSINQSIAGSHYIMLEPISTAAAGHRNLAKQLFMAPQLSFSTSGSPKAIVSVCITDRSACIIGCV